MWDSTKPAQTENKPITFTSFSCTCTDRPRHFDRQRLDAWQPRHAALHFVNSEGLTMKSHSALPTCLLLLWTLAVFFSCEAKDPEMSVSELADGIKLICPAGYKLEGETETEKVLAYKDENTGEYKCTNPGDQNPKSLEIFVKFRTCDNCIELDVASISGMIIGDVVATIVVGVGVYLIASHARPGPVTSNKKSKSSDRQHLVSESRGANEHYQPLRRGNKDTYEELTHRR